MYGNIIRLAPPMTLTEDKADDAISMLSTAIATAHKG